jgi:hypothetical protein
MGAGHVHPEQIVRTRPCALALAKDATMPVQALESQEPLAHMTLAALRHPPHPVDPCHRTPGPPCVSQECIHPPRGTLPLRTPSLPPPVLAHDQWPYTPAGVPVRLSSLVVHRPQARARIAQPWCRDGRGPGGTPPLHLAPCPRIPPQALAWAPTGAVPRLACRVALGRRRVTASAPPRGLPPGQRGGQLLDGLLGVPRLLAAPLYLTPGPPSPPRAPARLPPLPLVPLPRGIGLPGGVERPRGVVPLPRSDACECAVGVPHVQPHRQGLPGDGRGRRAQGAAGGLRQLHPACQTLAPSGDAVLQARPGGAHRAPTLPAALRPPSARPPRQAVGCERHQHRRAMPQDVVEPAPAPSHLPGQIAPHQPPPAPSALPWPAWAQPPRATPALTT